MASAVKTLRADGSSGGIVWFAIAANNKVKGDKGVYNDDSVIKRVTPTTTPIGERPFYLWDLISVSPDEYNKAYTKRPQGGLEKHHGSSLAVREFKGATFAAVCSEDDENSPAVPGYSNIAVSGEDMKSLAAKVKSSFRSFVGSADMMDIDYDQSAKKRPAGDEDNDDGSNCGGGKRMKGTDSSNVHVAMNVKAAELLEYRRKSFISPSAIEQAYAAAVLEKMQNSIGEVKILDVNGETKVYVMKKKMKTDDGNIIPWKVGKALTDPTTLKKKRKQLRADLYRYSDGSISEVASILKPNDLLKNFMESEGIRGKTQLRDILESNMKQQSSETTIDKVIVDNIKSFLSIEAHQMKGGDGSSKGGSRPDGVQHFLNGLVCAVSSTATSVQSSIGKRLGLSQHAVEKGAKDRAEVDGTSSSEAHKYCKPFERSKRGDKYDDIAHQVVHDYCHDLDVSGVDSNVDASRTCTVVLPSGCTAKHPYRVWIEKGDMKFQYQQFLKSEHYASFQQRVISEKPDYYSESRKPTIGYESFCQKACACVGDPTEMSCVDMTRDTLQLSIEGMEAYVSKNKDKLKEKLTNCLCADCNLPKIQKSVARAPKKRSWIDVFTRREENSVSNLIREVLCPREEQLSLTLDGDVHNFKMHKRNCGRLECWDCGPTRKLQWNCPIFMSNEDDVDYWEWEKCETSGGEQNQMVQKTAKVKELMASLRKKIEDGIKHEFDKTWLNRTRAIDIKTFPKKTMAICTDFSAMLSLRPNRTKCAHVDRHAVLAIFYVITNPRDVKLQDGTTVRVTDCDVWHIFGNAENKDTKNDHVFHNACLEYIIKYYLEEKGLDLDTIRVWTDNCTGQYKCRQNFYQLSKIPLGENCIKIAEHCFAQVYSFKGPWDAAGKVIKWFIRRLERMEKARVEDAFQCYEHSTKYFAENLPSGNDWKKLEEELSNKLKDKSVYEAVERIAGYATDDEEEYNRLVEAGHKHVVLTRRSEAEDTTVYDGSSDCHYFKGDGVVNENGIHLEMRSKPCRCNECRSDGAICTYQDIRGEPKDFYRKEKAEIAAEKEQKKKEAAMAHVHQVEGILANNSLLPLSNHRHPVLKSLVFVTGVEVVRRDGQTNNKGKPLDPLMSDRLHYLGEANLTNESVQAKINEIRNQFGENNTE